MKKINNSRGDTIVEVLISIAVVSVVLVSAFASARQSTKTTQSALEHTEALKIAEGQVEQLRILYSNNTLATSLDTQPDSEFCIDDTTGNPIPYAPADCESGDGVIYDRRIQRQDTPNDTNYTITITWDSLNGGQNREEIVYRTQ